MNDLQGRTFCVTGANTGIGRATAVGLAQRGGRVIVTGRAPAKMAETMRDIEGTAGSATFVPLDLGDLDSVAAGARAVRELDEPVHVLVNNAGIAGQRGRTDSGFELMFGVNHVGHFLWTELLRDLVEESAGVAGAPGRIVIVSSDAHYSAKGIDFDKVHDSTRSRLGMPEYSVSKLANVLHAQELARRLDPSVVVCHSLHPGVVASDIWRRVPGPVRFLMRRFMKTVEEGAQTSLHCATAPEAGQNTGLFWDDCREKPASEHATPDLATELWKRSEEWVTAHLS